MSYDGVIDPSTSAALASTAAGQASAAMVRAAASATAAAGSVATVAATQAAITALLAGIGIPHLWSGTSLQIRLPDGTYGEAVDLQGVRGPIGLTPVFQAGTVDTGEAAFTIDADDPTKPVLSLVLPKGDKGDQGGQGEAGVSGASFIGSSTTAATIALGIMSVVISDSQAFAPAQYQALISGADARNSVLGTLQSYDTVSGTLTISVIECSGSGVHADWIVTAATPPVLSAFVDDGLYDAAQPTASMTISYAADTATVSTEDDGLF